jgi:hypothetical protein
MKYEDREKRMGYIQKFLEKLFPTFEILHADDFYTGDFLFKGRRDRDIVLQITIPLNGIDEVISEVQLNRGVR